MTKKPILALTVSAALTVAVFAATARPGKVVEPVTVGNFVARLALALGVDASSQSAAAARLRASGVEVPENLSDPLTKGTAARLLADLGVKVVEPADPAATVSESMAGALATRAALTTSVSIESTGLPTQCLVSKNKGQCQECCKTATGCGAPPAPFDCNVCAKFCRSNVPPPPSSSQPPPP